MCHRRIRLRPSAVPLVCAQPDGVDGSVSVPVRIGVRCSSSAANGWVHARSTADRPCSSCRCPSNTQTRGLPRTRKAKCQDEACLLRFDPLTPRMAPS